jgi:hypothetical protein
MEYPAGIYKKEKNTAAKISFTSFTFFTTYTKRYRPYSPQLGFKKAYAYLSSFAIS